MILLLLGGSLLSGLLSCRLLGSRLLGGLGLLSCGLLGSLLGLLSSRLLLGLLGGLGLLSLGLLGGQLEGSSSLFASRSGSDESLGGNHLLQGQPDSGGSLGSINLVVGADVLQDGLAGGALLVSQSLDGSLDHGGVGRVGGGSLGLGGLLGLGGGGGSGGHGGGVLGC